MVSPDLFIGHKGLHEGAPDPDIVRDIHLHNGHAYIELVNGTTIKVSLTDEIKKLYWKVKIRNRRLAFGLD